MNVTTLVCTIVQGYGAVTLYPGIVESSRYNETSITISLNGDAVQDVQVSGPFDRDFSYSLNGFKFSLRIQDGSKTITATAESEGNFSKEVFTINDNGRLIWSQAAYADAFRAASASLYNGNCKVQQ